VPKAALVETHNSQQQRRQHWLHKQPTASQSKILNQSIPSIPSIKFHQIFIKNPASPISESFISSGKQGGGATVLRKGCDTVTRETCDPASLNVLGKAAVLHFAFF
jgi:hypothetical protein